jgi:large subunit ribosomal protein L29
MRVDEFRAISSSELSIRLEETKEELFNLRFSNATGQLENYKRRGALKRDVAKIETVIRERELGIEIEAKELLPPKPRKTRKKDEEEASLEAADANEIEDTDLQEEELEEEEASK